MIRTWTDVLAFLSLFFLLASWWMGSLRRQNTILDRLEQLESPAPDTAYIQQTVREPAPCVTPPAPADSVCLGSRQTFNQNPFPMNATWDVGLQQWMCPSERWTLLGEYLDVPLCYLPDGDVSTWDFYLNPPPPTDEEILQNLHRGVPTVLSVDGDEYTCVTLGRDNRRSTYPCDP